MEDSTDMKTPILFLVFNRPETTRLVFESIRSARPPALYVVADGPRPGVVGEGRKCEEVRQIATAIDWDCSLYTLYRDQNLGTGGGIATGITWFFDHVEEGIVLEDDCIPSRSFYRFCEDLLAYYRELSEIMHISGDNFQYGRGHADASYYFSKYAHTWGWATWRRAWQHYDFTLIPEADRSHIWDAQWQLTVENHKGMAVVPAVNLVKNVGYDSEATHTKTITRAGFLPALEIDFPLKHPSRIAVDPTADRRTYYANFRNVPDLRMIWLYRIADFILLLPVRLGKAARKLRSIR